LANDIGAGATGVNDWIKRIVQPARQQLRIRRRLRSYADLYLRRKGWQRSVALRESVGPDGPVPWITFPALMMLERIVEPHYKVFEYGCGNSSLWWSRRVSSVVSVEHDEAWAARIARIAPPNLTIVVRRLGENASPELAAHADAFFSRNPDLPVSGDLHHDLEHGLICREFVAYATEIARHGKGHFDVVVVDGMARVLTAWMAANFVKDDGIILFDNSDRWQYNSGFAALAERGFRRVDFYGTGPVNPFESCTSIFARNLDWAARNTVIPPGQISQLGW